MEEVKEEKKIKKNNKSYIIIIVVLSLIILGLVGYVVYDKNQSKEEAKQNQETNKKEESEKEINKEEESKEITIVDKIDGFDENEYTNQKYQEYLDKGILVNEVYLQNEKSWSLKEKIGLIVIDSNTNTNYYISNKTNKIYSSNKYSFEGFEVRLSSDTFHLVNDYKYIRVLDEKTESIYSIVDQKIIISKSKENEMSATIYSDANDKFLIIDNGEYRIIDADDKTIVSGYDYIDYVNSRYYITIKDNKLGIYKDYKELLKPTFDLNVENSYGESGFKTSFEMCCGATPPYNLDEMKNGNILFDIYRNPLEAYIINSEGTIIKTIKYGEEYSDTNKYVYYIEYNEAEDIIIATTKEKQYDGYVTDEITIKTVKYSPDTGEEVK